MLERLAFLVLVACMASCATTTVYGPDDLEGQPASGSIKPLAEVLDEAGGKRLRLIFVHGVGDHCAGYALDPETGWLADPVAARIGLAAKGAALPTYEKVPASVFVAGSRNASSYLEVGRRRFSLRLGPGAPVDVEAVEITWSHTTQWLKSNYLGYDSASVTPRAGDAATGCVDAENKAVPLTKRPPGRLPLDRLIKEQVFDRNLADAIIYSGRYGVVVERAFAEGLCRALVETPVTQACAWQAVDGAAEATWRTIFVTHSLGSRIVYDGLLDLAGAESPGRRNTFHPSEWMKSRRPVEQLIADTPAVLMMANQLSLLGLANAPPLSRADEEPKPLLVGPGLDVSMAAVPEPLARQVASERLAAHGCPTAMAAFAQLRAQAVVAKKGLAARDALTLRVIAFNDTNDLLTWHIPSWYAKGDETCPAPMALTNVFVRNAFPWLIAESPLPAHNGYFRNDDVWQAIACGAEKGELLACER